MLIDANLLLYAVFKSYPQHTRAKAWLDDVLNTPHRVAIPWATLLAFFRIVTNTRVFQKPIISAEA